MEVQKETTRDQVSHPVDRTSRQSVSGRSSGFRIVRLTAPSRAIHSTVALAAFVPGYSGGTATESHRLPYSPTNNTFVGTSLIWVMLREISRKSTKNHGSDLK